MEAKWAYMFTLDCRVTHWQIGNGKYIYIYIYIYPFSIHTTLKIISF